VRRHPPHHLSPAEQTTRQGVILWGASAAPQPAQQRSDQGRKPVISAQSRWRGQFRTSISRFESSRPSQPFVRSAGFARKRQNGPEIAAFREFILSPDSRFADPEVEITESLRPCPQIFPFCGDHRRRPVGSQLPPEGGILQTIRIVGPFLRKIQRAVDERMTMTRNVGSEDSDLAVRNLACRTSVLPRHSA
jgi:hypothetical protein